MGVARNERFFVTPLTAEVANPIGCGDAFTAGLALGLGQGLTLAEASQRGAWAAWKNLQQILPGTLGGCMTPPLKELPEISLLFP